MALFEQGFEAPSTHSTSFNCPHCKALAKQFWYSTHAHQLEKDRLPPSLDSQSAETFGDDVQDEEQRESWKKWAKRLVSEEPFLDETSSSPYSAEVNNLSVSRCYNCDEVSIWIGSRLIYPVSGNIVAPNADTPKDAIRDYREAAEIVNISPRGAAALLRLSVQKICKALGEPGENINADISSLVKKGLDPRIQQALDVVRVIGNNAVHPGELDIRDDRAVAERLFQLVNLIVEVTITQPKHVTEMYAALPEGAKSAVARRDQS